MKTNSKKLRWKTAQSYELDWWKYRSNNISLDYFRDYADDLLEHLNGIKTVDQNAKILEIGSGPAGIITFLESPNRYGIDPLEHFFSQVPSFKDFRDKQVKYCAAMGEFLPFPDKTFDFIITDNVLDHCENPEGLIIEVNRVLKLNGILTIRVNTYNIWGKIIRQLLERLKVDKGHPYTFTKNGLTSLFRSNNLKILKLLPVGYLKAWIKEITAGRLKELVMAILIVIRDTTLYILIKENTNHT